MSINCKTYSIKIGIRNLAFCTTDKRLQSASASFFGNRESAYPHSSLSSVQIVVVARNTYDCMCTNMSNSPAGKLYSTGKLADIVDHRWMHMYIVRVYAWESRVMLEWVPSRSHSASVNQVFDYFNVYRNVWMIFCGKALQSRLMTKLLLSENDEITTYRTSSTILLHAKIAKVLCSAVGWVFTYMLICCALLSVHCICHCMLFSRLIFHTSTHGSHDADSLCPSVIQYVNFTHGPWWHGVCLCPHLPYALLHGCMWHLVNDLPKAIQQTDALHRISLHWVGRHKMDADMQFSASYPIRRTTILFARNFQMLFRGWSAFSLLVSVVKIWECNTRKLVCTYGLSLQSAS